MKKQYLIQYKITADEVIANRIKSITSSWIKFFDNSWLIESTLTAKEIYEKISLSSDEFSVIIIEINKGSYYGRMNTKIWDWLKQKRS